MGLNRSASRMETGLVVTSAETRQGTGLLLASTEIVAYGYSCKHFCCREGLEKPRKPRKPRKRAASNHKAGNLNQLTLSAAITKRDKTADIGRGKQPAKETTKLTAASKGERSSQSKFPKFPLARRASSQGQNGAKGTTDRAAMTTKGEKSIEKPEMVSSDFDDDSFDDLPPLSYIMQGLGSGPRPADSNPRQKSDKIFDSPLPGVNQTQAKNQPDKPQLLQTPKPRDVIELSDDSTPEPGQDIFTHPEDIGSSITIAPPPSASGNTIHPLTRKSSSFCRAYEARILERAERLSSPKRLLPALNPRHTLTQLEPMSTVDLTSKNHAQRTLTNSSSGWDDVDRLSMEEFKDVINHY